MFKVPGVLNRAAFWPWATCLVLGHILLTLATISGAKLGALDSLVVIALALAVGARFRDIGWPQWTGVTFVVLTMLVGPLIVTAYAIANNLRPPQFMEAMNVYGWFSGPLNLALLIVAGSMPGRAVAPAESGAGVSETTPAEETESPSVSMLQPAMGSASTASVSAEAESPSVQMRSALLIAASGVLALVVIAVLMINARAPQPTAAPPTAISAGPAGVASNGLTKETSDYLRQLQYGSAAKTAPRYQFVVPAPAKAAP